MICLRNSRAYTWTLIYTNDHNLTLSLYSDRQRFTNDDCVIFMSGSKHDFFRDVIHFMRFQLILLSQSLSPPPLLQQYRKNNKPISSRLRLTTF